MSVMKVAENEVVSFSLHVITWLRWNSGVFSLCDLQEGTSWWELVWSEAFPRTMNLWCFPLSMFRVFLQMTFSALLFLFISPFFLSLIYHSCQNPLRTLIGINIILWILENKKYLPNWKSNLEFMYGFFYCSFQNIKYSIFFMKPI
jgi:hypothetical protein